MKLFILLMMIGYWQGFIYAQKFDYVWVMGRENQLLDTTFGGGLLDFNFSPPKASYHYREHNMYTTNSSICDSTGNLLFYTNGCVIAGADDAILENGEGINPGNAHTLWCEQYNEGYSGGPGASVILPMPDSSGLFYLFHKRFTLFNNPVGVNIDKFYFTIVDMNQNIGSGKVTAKNVEMMSDSLARGEIAAVKHANGKDWWLVTAINFIFSSSPARELWIPFNRPSAFSRIRRVKGLARWFSHRTAVNYTVPIGIILLWSIPLTVRLVYLPNLIPYPLIMAIN
jgi:hypothetical protein